MTSCGTTIFPFANCSTSPAPAGKSKPCAAAVCCSRRSRKSRWPYYRKGQAEHPVCRAFAAVFNADLAVDFGPAAYDILVILKKTER